MQPAPSRLLELARHLLHSNPGKDEGGRRERNGCKCSPRRRKGKEERERGDDEKLAPHHPPYNVTTEIPASKDERDEERVIFFPFS